MTAYRNYVSDFPGRCLEVLSLSRGKPELQEREVTLLLMAASTSLLVPFERLRIKENGEKHPAGDADQFPVEAHDLKSLLASRFLGSAIWPPSKPGSWQIAKGLPNIDGDPEQWLQNKLKPISNEKTVGGILAILRNALAHGNLFTQGQPIEKILMVNVHWKDVVKGAPSVPDNFDALSVTPHDLESMLRDWVKFLQSSACMRLLLAA